MLYPNGFKTEIVRKKCNEKEMKGRGKTEEDLQFFVYAFTFVHISTYL